MNPYNALLRTAGRTRAFAWVGSRLLHRLDLPLRGGRRALTDLGTGFPLAFVTTRGRRSGEPRTVPLLYAEADAGAIVLSASNWGRRHHPAWASNLDAEPGATFSVHGVERRMRARRCTPEERDRYWPQLVAIWPGYEGYRRRAGREIRLYLLEPEQSGSDARVGPRMGLKGGNRGAYSRSSL